MRLLKIKTRELESFLGDAPPYVILSHTWGPGEVTLQDVQSRRDGLDTAPGWNKIVNFCKAVVSSADLSYINYVWVDTCCIDKTSSAELSEALNAMFRWYTEAECCYAYLEDAHGTCSEKGDLTVGADLEHSRWFTRGWTLQELIAPRDLRFFDRDWQLLGDKRSLAKRISARTGIGVGILETGDLSGAGVAERMSWAADRQTTRLEDMAYCLLGIFDINMAMLYGEGRKAFLRLQEEILKEYDDHSIFAWDASEIPESEGAAIGALAPHPRYFRGSASIVPSGLSRDPIVVTNKGIQISLATHDRWGDARNPLAELLCHARHDAGLLVGIELIKLGGPLSESELCYSRARSAPVNLPDTGRAAKERRMYLTRRHSPNLSQPGLWTLRFPLPPIGFSVRACYPAPWWNINASQLTMTLPRDERWSGRGVRPWHEEPVRFAAVALHWHDAREVVAIAFRLRPWSQVLIFAMHVIRPKPGEETPPTQALVYDADLEALSGESFVDREYLLLGERGLPGLEMAGKSGKVLHRGALAFHFELVSNRAGMLQP